MPICILTVTFYQNGLCHSETVCKMNVLPQEPTCYFFLKLIEQKDSPAPEWKRPNLLISSLMPCWPSVINLSGMRKTKAWTWNIKDMTQRPGGKACPRLWTHSSPALSWLDPSARNHLPKPECWFSPASGFSAGRCPGAQGSPGKDWKGDGDLGVSFSSVLFLQFIFLNGCVVLLSLKKEKHCLIFHLLTCSWGKIHTLESAQLGEFSQTKHPHVTSTRSRSRMYPATPPQSDHHLTSNIMHSCSQVADWR